MGQSLKVPLIGCALHKFNLAVRKWIAEQPDLIAIIQKASTVIKKASQYPQDCGSTLGVH
jgi:hypothetical protein